MPPLPAVSTGPDREPEAAFAPADDLLARNAPLAAALLASMAHPKRLLALCHLLEGERTAGDLAVRVGLSPSALSQHLAKMRAAGLVDSRRDGQAICYFLAGHEARAVLETLHRLYCAPSSPPSP
ncbi:metalloregulator ArsR/SmtB family transcription factor [Xanthobacter sp. DSM 24535]|uniref:ArsR/SmtB family transcription factor n=1 Tax=Roseixanthobacter psychrophilus TaxID=3119917 RepID=UPI003729E36D